MTWDICRLPWLDMTRCWWCHLCFNCSEPHLSATDYLRNNVFCLTRLLQIVNWRTHLKFPEEAKLSPEAKDLISKLLCNVNQRLGTNGADEIKVLYGVSCSKFLQFVHELVAYNGNYVAADSFFRFILGSMVLNGISFIKWMLHLFLRSMMIWILKILKSSKRYRYASIFVELWSYLCWAHHISDNLIYTNFWSAVWLPNSEFIQNWSLEKG